MSAHGAEYKLTDAGAFAGQLGLRGLAECDAFWEKQLYGTRLYYGEGIMDYLHRDVLRTVLTILDKPNAKVMSHAVDMAKEIIALKQRNRELLAALEIVLIGLQTGKVKSAPIMPAFDEHAESVHPISLESFVGATIAKSQS